MRENVEAIFGDRHFFNGSIVALGEDRQVIEEIIADAFFVVRDGFDVDERACEFENVHRYQRNCTKDERRQEGGAELCSACPDSAPSDPQLDPDDSGQVLTSAPQPQL